MTSEIHGDGSLEARALASRRRTLTASSAPAGPRTPAELWARIAFGRLAVAHRTTGGRVASAAGTRAGRAADVAVSRAEDAYRAEACAAHAANERRRHAAYQRYAAGRRETVLAALSASAGPAGGGVLTMHGPAPRRGWSSRAPRVRGELQTPGRG